MTKAPSCSKVPKVIKKFSSWQEFRIFRNQARQDQMNVIPKLRQLRALYEVSKSESVSRAAHSLNLSQPAVTRSIKNLEKEFDVSLFSRTSRRMTLTDSGTVLLKRVERALTHLRQAEIDLARSKRYKKTSESLHHLSRFSTNRELDAVIYTAENQSVSMAARQMGVSQPAVNRSLRTLEQRLGLNLFERTPHGMKATSEGNIVVLRSKIAYSEIHKAIEELANLKGSGKGSIKVGSLPLARVQLIPVTVNLFLKTNPDVRFSITEGMYESQIQKLSHGDIDLLVGTIRDSHSQEEITAHKLFDENSVLVARSNHPLLKRKQLTLLDLKDASWVVPHPNVPMRDHMEKLFVKNDMAFPERYVETDSLVVVRSLLMESDRIALVSKREVYLDEKLGLVKELPISLNTPIRPVGFVTRTDFSPTPSLKKFIQCLNEVASDISS